MRSFNDEKHLTTTKYTPMHPIEELVAVSDAQCDYGNVVVGSFLGVSAFLLHIVLTLLILFLIYKLTYPSPSKWFD